MTKHMFCQQHKSIYSILVSSPLFYTRFPSCHHGTVEHPSSLALLQLRSDPCVPQKAPHPGLALGWVESVCAPEHLIPGVSARVLHSLLECPALAHVHECLRARREGQPDGGVARDPHLVQDGGGVGRAQQQCCQRGEGCGEARAVRAPRERAHQQRHNAARGQRALDLQTGGRCAQ